MQIKSELIALYDFTNEVREISNRHYEKGDTHFADAMILYVTILNMFNNIAYSAKSQEPVKESTADLTINLILEAAKVLSPTAKQAILTIRRLIDKHKVPYENN